MMYNKALSPSGLKLFNTCPRKWADSYIDGNRPPAGPAAKRGTQIHTQVEHLFKRPQFYPSVSLALQPWNKFFETLYSMENVVAEGEVAVDSNWEPVPFSHEDAYFRGVIDLRIFEGDTCSILDWKTGKVYPDHEFQAECYVALSPEYPKYEALMVYLDHPHKVQQWDYTPEDRAALIESLQEGVEKVRSATEYPATPSQDGCNWCHLNWRNGGACRRAP